MSFHFWPRKGTTLQLGIGLNAFTRILNQITDGDWFFAPKKNDRDYHLTLPQVKEIVNKRKRLLELADTDGANLSLTSWHIMFCECAVLLEADAKAYLDEMIDAAETLGLKGKERGKFLQRGSKKYRVYFQN